MRSFWFMAATFGLAAPAWSQGYDQGVHGSATGQGAGQSYVTPYNEPARNVGGAWPGPGAWSPPTAPRGSYDLLAPAPNPVQPPGRGGNLGYDDRFTPRR